MSDLSVDYLVRLVQIHLDFRKAELVSLAAAEDIKIQILEYDDDSPFCVVRLPSDEAARLLISRSILSLGVYEIWGRGATYSSLHDGLRHQSPSVGSRFETSSFKLSIDSYRHKRTPEEQLEIINSFAYLPLKGPIQVRPEPQLHLCIFESFDVRASQPNEVFLGRLVGLSGRQANGFYDLKKRHYISTTSMDAELSLLTANIALSGPGKLFYDPFVGTGGLILACAHFGAITLGSDIDGRTVRGKDGRSIISNYEQYGLRQRLLDSFTADITNSPLMKRRFLDGIVCDPPYGVREGLKVLGSKGIKGKTVVLLDGSPAHLKEDYIPPRKPYSFEALLDDILQFAAETLVDNARLVFWMPEINEENARIRPPQHGCLELVGYCTQKFNKWSRRLLIYKRLPASMARAGEVTEAAKLPYGAGSTANELNAFRRRFFEKSIKHEALKQSTTEQAIAGTDRPSEKER